MSIIFLRLDCLAVFAYLPSYIQARNSETTNDISAKQLAITAFFVPKENMQIHRIPEKWAQFINKQNATVQSLSLTKTFIKLTIPVVTKINPQIEKKTPGGWV